MTGLDGNCIFCKIIIGEIPSHKAYEDERFLAFLDIAPIDRGHTVLIPKVHVENCLELPEEHLKAFGEVVSVLGKRLRERTGACALNILSNIGERAGQIVMHAHIHLIPRYEGDEPINWIPGEGDHTELAALAKRIRGEA